MNNFQPIPAETKAEPQNLIEQAADKFESEHLGALVVSKRFPRSNGNNHRNG